MLIFSLSLTDSVYADRHDLEKAFKVGKVKGTLRQPLSILSYSPLCLIHRFDLFVYLHVFLVPKAWDYNYLVRPILAERAAALTPYIRWARYHIGESEPHFVVASLEDEGNNDVDSNGEEESDQEEIEEGVQRRLIFNFDTDSDDDDDT